MERRTAVRRACSFDVEVATKTGPIKGIGLEISTSGLCFVLPRGPGVETLAVTALIRSQKFALTVKIVRSDPMPYQLETWAKLACAIVVPPSDWNAIVEGTHRGPGKPDAAALAPGAQTRLAVSATGEILLGALPAGAQQSIVSQLIDLKRLASPRAGHAPLVRVTLGPEYRDAYGKVVHRYRVHSRIVSHAHTKSFETIFLVSGRGEVTLER